MNAIKSNPPFPAVGGHVAIDFVNTRPMRDGRPHELLDKGASFILWAKQVELIDPHRPSPFDPKTAGALLPIARKLRDAILTLVEARAAGRRAPREAMDLLNRLAAASGSKRLLVQNSDGHFSIERGASPTTPRALLARVAECAIDLLTGPLASRLRQCEGKRCVLWFVDTTRNHSRHWCRMDRCGARAKAATYYKRNRPEPKKKGAAPEGTAPS